MKIGIFDSGIGGITVLNEALKMLPNEEYIYYADSYNAPYGNKPKDVVREYIFQVVEFLNEQQIDALVIACNTATSIAVRELRKIYDFPIIGMEPAVKSAIECNKDKRILVTATNLTLREEKYHKLVQRFDKQLRVDSLALPKLVEFAENYIFERNEIVPYLIEQLGDYDWNDYSSIVLGCTHFPFYKKWFQEILPEHVNIVDGNVGTIKHLKNILAEKEEKFNNDGGKVTFYYCGKEDKDNYILNKYLKIL